MEAPRPQERLIAILLPERVAARRAAGPLAASAPRSSAEDAGSGLPAKPVRILIAEDEILAALHLESLLAQLGYVVVGIAATAARAVATAEQQRPDLVLMDIRLGASDGIAAADEILTRLGIRALYVTAHNDPATRQRAQRTRPLGWVLKPASDHEITTALRQALVQLGQP